jgi:hypothetical protein
MTSFYRQPIRPKARVVPVIWFDSLWHPEIHVRPPQSGRMTVGALHRLQYSCPSKSQPRTKPVPMGTPPRASLCARMRPFSVFVSSKLGSNGISRLSYFSSL